MFFWNSLAFFDDPTDVGNLMSAFSAFSNTSLNIGNFMVHILLKPGLENFEHYLASMWDEGNYAVVWLFFGIAFLWDWNENWPLPVLWPLLSFSDLLAYFTTSSFRIWNSSTGIPSFPLALFEVMLRPTWLCNSEHLALGEWSHHRDYLDREDLFYIVLPCIFCHLFLISSASVRFIPFLSFIVPIFAGKVPLVSLIFLKRSLVFPILLFSSISLHWSLRKAFLSLCYSLELCIYMGISFLLSFAFSFSSFLSYLEGLLRQPILPFCISFSWGWSWSLPPVQCHEPPTIVLRHSMRSNPLNLFVTSTV